jgi:molybdopterin-guanine dinucleotide biosynthesis protein B
MLPIISIVGASNSGKTTFLEKLIPELVSRGYKVGAIKHDAHGFEMDREGKDTWRLRRAGAGVIAISSTDQLAWIRRTDSEMNLQEIAARFFWSEDILITEGFKSAHFPKIEVFRSAVEPKPICSSGDNLIALITDDAVDAQVPGFSFSDPSGVADFLEGRYLRDRKKRRMLVLVDGKPMPMKDFVEDFVAGGIIGMLSTLRGYDNPDNISIHIRLGEND